MTVLSGNSELESKRCDCGILELGLFVAQQDRGRIPKTIRPEPGRRQGEVKILRFRDQNEEARGIAQLCTYLIHVHNLNPGNILILIRSDRNGVFSSPIRKRLEAAKVPVSAATDTGGPFDSLSARAFLSFMRLVVNREDSLAWRTLLQVWCQGIGPAAINAVYDLARSQGMGFAKSLLNAHNNPHILPSKHRNRLSEAIDRIMTCLQELFPGNSQAKYGNTNELLDVVRRAVESFIGAKEEQQSVLIEFERAAESVGAKSLEELVRATEVMNEDIEQEINPQAVNIMTMHKAKGLTAEAVIIAAAEDQYLPGRSQGDALDDERRLLYVSLTRAKHHLFITYCDRRMGPQQHTGRDSGKLNRHLTQFLRDCPYKPEDSKAFLARLTEERQ